MTYPTRRVRVLAPAVLALAALAGCSMAPRYQPPAVGTLPAAFKEVAGWTLAQPADDVARGEWWQLFNDPELDRLERRLAVDNQTVAQARAAYLSARGLVEANRSALLPSVSASASGTHSTSFQGGSVSFSTSGVTTTRYSLSASASWVPDLWGKLGDSLRNAKGQAAASAGDLANALLSAQAELASDYLSLRGLDAQLDLADALVAMQTRALAVATNKLRAGTTTRSDLANAEINLRSAEANRDELRHTRAVTEHAIAVLVGANPSTFGVAPAPFTGIVPPVPGVVPASLLQRRPDIAAAERRVMAANANIGVARAAYFPQISLSAGPDTAGSSISALFTAASSVWSLGLSTTATLLDFGARHGAVVQARGNWEQASASYRQTVLTAFGQVEDNLAAVREFTAEMATRRSASAQATIGVTVARNQLAAGTADFSTVASAEANAATTRQNEIQTVVNAQTATIGLIQAIGGRWTDPAP